MVLTVPTKPNQVPDLKQGDVRETPAATATATAVGLTGESYVLVGAGSADLTAERTLTAGEGISFTDAGAGSTITIYGETASDTNRGIATFQATDFTVTTGDVALKAVVVMSVDGDTGTATPAVHNIDILGGDGITTAGASNDIIITSSDHTAVGLNTTHRGSAGTDHSDVGLANTHRGLTNEHLDWTADLGATNINAGNYTDTNTQLSDGDIAGFGYTKDTEVDWTVSQAPAVVHAANYTDTGDTTYTAGEGLDLTGTVFSAETSTTTNPGIMEIATEDEVQTGTDTARAVVPDTLQSVLSPIGSIVAWLKSYTNTPQTLPTGWVECAGQTLSDADSVYNGQVIPDLNGDNRFLRGNATSGGTGGSATMAHGHGPGTLELFSDQSFADDASGARIMEDREGNGDLHVIGNNTGNIAHVCKRDLEGTSAGASNDENKPPYYNVVWIMRIK